MTEQKKENFAFGTIGCGDIVEKSFIPAIQANPRATLLAATRKNPEKLKTFCETYAIERAYPDIEDLLNDADIDVVYIATPVGCHLEQIIAAAEHAKHILCEKPMGLNHYQACQAMQVASANGVKLSVAYYRRCFPEITAIHELLVEQQLGEILSLRFHYGTWYQPEPNSPEAWRLDPALGGGGALMDVGSHRLDLVCFLFDRINRISCRLSHQIDDWQVESGATALLEFDGGGEGQVSVYFNQKQKTDQVWIYGSKANIYCPKLGGGQIIIEENGSKETLQLEPTQKSQTHIPVIKNVVNELIDSKDNPFAIDRIIATEQIIDACYRSAKQGCWVNLQQELSD